MIKPMLCETGDLPDLRRHGYLAEEKYDGTMGILGKKADVVTIWNRNGINYTRRLPDLVEAAKQVPGDFTIQGEIVYINPETGEIEFTPSQRRCATQDFAKREYLMRFKKILVDFFAWSLIELNGESLKKRPYIEQKEVLRKLIPSNSRIRWAPHRFDIEQFFEEVKQKQGEGIIMKRINSGYELGRSFSWLKIKNWRRRICKAAGFTPGNGTRSGFFGSLVLTENGKFVGVAGSGPDDWELRQLKDAFTDGQKIARPFDIGQPWTAVKTNLEVEVKYYKITKAGVMRFPVFERIISK